MHLTSDTVDERSDKAGVRVPYMALRDEGTSSLKPWERWAANLLAGAVIVVAVTAFAIVGLALDAVFGPLFIPGVGISR
jgi:hypothetical protein